MSSDIPLLLHSLLIQSLHPALALYEVSSEARGYDRRRGLRFGLTWRRLRLRH